MSRMLSTPLIIDLVPSKIQRHLFIVLHVLVLLSIIILDWPLWLRVVAIGIYFGIIFYGHKSQHHATRIVWQSENYWLVTINAKTIEAALLAGSLHTRGLLILRFRAASGQRYAILIWSDSAQPEDFRRLRVRLKLEAEKLLSQVS